jgi:Fe2+ or Zn2+ uptake regulation protein
MLCPICEKPRFRVIAEENTKITNLNKIHFICENCGCIMQLKNMELFKMEKIPETEEHNIT